MSERWLVWIMLGDQKRVPVDGAYAFITDRKISLWGDLDRLKIIAAAAGEWHFFAMHGLYGFRLHAEMPGRTAVKFWWLFGDAVAHGHSRKLSWTDSVPYVAAMTSAGYARSIMTQAFQHKAVANEAAMMQWRWEDMQSWMLETFQRMAVFRFVASTEELPDIEDPEESPDRVLFTFQDGSVAEFSVHGWREVEEEQCAVSYPCGQGKVGTSLVRILPAEDGTDWKIETN